MLWGSVALNIKEGHNMKILVACERSQAVTVEMRKLGHEAYSCDILECAGPHPEWHIQDDVRNVLRHDIVSAFMAEYDMVIAHPDCTYLTVTGNKWMKEQPARKSGALVGAARQKAREEAILFFEFFTHLKNRHVAIENPVGVMSTVYRKPDQIIQPYQFGHKEPKKTCLWLKNLPKLVPTCIVEPEYHTTKSGKKAHVWYSYADKSKGQAHRAGIRSRTFQGVAQAMAMQWAGPVEGRGNCCSNCGLYVMPFEGEGHKDCTYCGNPMN